MKTILSLDKLGKIYPNGFEALKQVSFEVKEGEFLALIGLSGSGKSTLLRCINHLHPPTSGQLQFKGRDIMHLSKKEVRTLRESVAMVFQQFNLIPRHSVLSNVLMGGLSRTGSFSSILGLYSESDREKALQYLELVGIREKAYLRASQLSGGQQQRVAIARALLQEPDLLLADEPVASLDPSTCHTVMDYLEKVNREMNITIICSLHFLSLVQRYATRVVALKGGKVVYIGKPESINEEWFREIYGEEAREIQEKVVSKEATIDGSKGAA